MDPDWTQRVNAHAAALDAFKARPDESTRSALRDAMCLWMSSTDVDDALWRLKQPYWIELYNAYVVTPLMRKTKT